MAHFVRIVANAGCQHFIVHARKAWLQGLSPKENRTIPPLRYEEVHRLKQEFPQLFIEINGGFKTLAEVKDQLQFVDAVMIGRAAYDHPYLFATADQEIYGEKTPPLTRQEVIEAMYPYLEYWLQKGVKLNSMTRHFLELFARQPGTKAWKRYISENAHLTHAGVEVLEQALKQLP
jgi:tRNA-dihydrouridine synthase A